MSEREELEGLIDEVRPSVAALLSCHPVDEEGSMVSVPSHLIHDVVGSFAFIRRALSRLPKGNGELVEAVRPALDWLDRYIDEFGELCSDGDDAVAAIESARKALSDSETVANSGGDDLRGPVAWLIADPDLMNESAWTIESDPAPESHGVSMPLHIHPDHAAAFDALIESAGSKRPYHAILAARSAAQDTQRAERATNGGHHDEG